MQRVLGLLAVLLLVGLTSACSTDSTSTDQPPDQPPVGNVDTSDGPLLVDEAAISASLQGTMLRVHIPITTGDSLGLKGIATVALRTLDDTLVMQRDVVFEVVDGAGTASVTVPTTNAITLGAAEAGLLVRWEVRSGPLYVAGYKSLLYTLPKVDLRARFPSNLTVDADAKIRVFALDPVSNAPKPGLDVRLALAPANPDDAAKLGTETVVTGTTDDAGTVVLDVPGQKEEGQLTATAEATEGGYLAAAATSELVVQRSHRVLVTTDKPVYQPGQTMHIRALVLKKPLLDADSERDLTFEVYDGKGNMVFRKFQTTDAFGVTATEFKIATQVNTGAYKVKAVVGDTTTEKTVEVKPYVLPKFALGVSVDAPFYIAGQTVTGTVDARYFFGKPVAGGTVQIRGVTIDVQTTEFASLSGTTGPEGLFDFELALPDYLVGQPLEGGNALVVLEVTVTDTADHGEVKTLPLVVSDSAINLVAVPESGALVPGLPNRVFLFATDPLNRPVDVTFDVTSPADISVDPIGEGVASFDITPNGPVALVVAASTDAGETAETSVTLTPGEATAALLLRTDKSLYRVGGTLNLTVLSTAASGGRAFIDIVKDGQTQLTKGLDIVGGVGMAAIDLDPGLVGDVLIAAYQVTPDAEIIRDTKRVFVRDAKALTIDISPGQDLYAPGEEATIDFTVSHADGAPAVAAIGVQIVDEAVFAVTDNKPGLLETYFLVADELAQPRYEIHGFNLSMTDVITGDPSNTVAQATAEASFAALGGGLAGETSSWSQLVGEVRAVLKPWYDAHLALIEADLQARTDTGEDPADVGASLADQSLYYDYWGTPYRFAVSSDWQGSTAAVTSAGPDERWETADDFTGSVTMYQDRWAWDDADGGPGGQVPVPEAPNAAGGEGGGADVKVRQDFPETLLFEPALITDGQGKASVTLTMADSITEWRISTLANTPGGALGSATGGVTVFQDFFVDIDFPASLTRNDEISFPVAIYNYLPAAQTVTITLSAEPWFAIDGASEAVVELAPGEVTSVSFPVQVLDVGVHSLTVTGTAAGGADAVRRVVRVVPDGREVRETAGGLLKGDTTHAIAFPTELIPGSGDVQLKVYPGIMAQAVDGLDSILQMPSGCFEQTTATNWPNTLVLRYIQASGQVTPEIELKALDFLQQGYQRLLTFECTGGGFVWFGDPAPANVVLSAMGVLEFADMAAVIEVDAAVIERTATWLVGAQHPDGHWHTDQGSEFATVQYDDVKTTAFSAWALAESPHGAAAVSSALAWLAPAAADPTTDIYSLALMANAFASAEPTSSRTTALLNRLAELAVEDGDVVYWEYEGSSFNYGGPDVGGVNGTSIEVTALAIQALLSANQHLDLVSKAIGFLAGNKDAFGNWGTTHATILSLRAMVASLQNKTEEGEGTITVRVDGEVTATAEVTAENRNVFHQFELASAVPASGGDVTVGYEGTGNLMYQLTWTHWLPGELLPPRVTEVLAIDVSYDKTALAVNDVATATVTVTNTTEAALQMVMVDLGVPPGFSVLTDRLDALVADGVIAKYELPGQQISVYIETIAPNASLTLAYDLLAKYPVRAQSGDAAAYLYYDTEQRAESGSVELVIE